MPPQTHPDERVPCPILSEEQLDWFAQTQSRTVRKAVRKTLLSAFVGYVILFTGTMGVYLNGQHVSGEERTAVVTSGNVVAVDGCNRDYDTVESLRGLLQRAQGQVAAAKDAGEITDRQAEEADAFYVDELQRLKLPDCRRAATTLTDDPDATLPAPSPKYPDKPEQRPIETGTGG